MALVGGAPQSADWQWRTHDDDDDVAPVTSRSPSFVQPPSESRHREPLESLVVIAEPPRRHESGVVPIVRLESEDRWAARQVALRVAALKLEEAARGALDDQRTRNARSLLAEVSALEDPLRALVSQLAGDAEGLLAHAYEWATNVLVRAESALVGGGIDDLPVDEYSSLFVRAILDPMLDTAIAARSRAGDERTAQALRTLREGAFWVNWTARRVVAA